MSITHEPIPPKPLTLFRAIAYVDGFNLYHGLRDAGFRRYYWLDIGQLAAQFLRGPLALVQTKYFTSRIDGPHRSDSPSIAERKEASRVRQTTFLDALSTLTDLQIIEGHFLTDTVECKSCGYRYRQPKEKMTDVNIATRLLIDAFRDEFDTAYLVSGDSDLAPPIEAIRAHFPHKRVYVAFPPQRHSNQLKSIAHNHFRINESMLRASQLPETVTTPGGMVLTRPERWK